MYTKISTQLLNTVKKINIAIFLFLIFFLGSCSSTNAPMKEETTSLPTSLISEASVTIYQYYPASVEGAVNIEIRPQVSGSLEKVFVDEGAFVNAGQPLFKINDLPYIQQLNTAEAQLHASEGALLTAQIEIDKLTPLVQNKVVSDYQLKAAKAAYQIAKANNDQASANVSTAKIFLDYTLIKASVSGYTGRLLKKQGSLVAPTDAEPLTLLSDVHEVHVYFSLSEQDFISFKDRYAGDNLLDKISQIPSVSLLLANDSVYPGNGKIDMIDGQFNKTTGSIALRATFPNTDGTLRSGNTGKIRLSVVRKNILLIPQSATVEMQDKVFVYTVGDSNKVSKKPIVIINKSGTNYLVTEGVKAGDQIVLSGLDHLQDGKIISPQKENAKVVSK